MHSIYILCNELAAQKSNRYVQSGENEIKNAITKFQLYNSLFVNVVGQPHSMKKINYKKLWCWFIFIGLLTWLEASEFYHNLWFEYY